MIRSSASLHHTTRLGALSPLGALCTALLYLTAGSVGNAAARGVQEVSVVGHWEGAISLPARPLDIRVDFARKGDAWKGPDYGVAATTRHSDVSRPPSAPPSECVR